MPRELFPRHVRPQVLEALAESRAVDLGYDERFRRLWRMYLAYCEAGFTERRIGVMQMMLAKPGWHQYAGPTSAYETPRALTF